MSESPDRIALSDYHPQPALRVAATRVERPAVRAIDVHNHLGRWLTAWVRPGGGWMTEDVGALLALMDSLDLEAIVNLDGRWGDELEANLERYDRAHPGRFRRSATSTGVSATASPPAWRRRRGPARAA